MIPALKFLRRKSKDEVPWEVVERKAVDPLPMYYDDELEDLDIVSTGGDTLGTYIFDLRKHPEARGLRNALLFARQQLLQEVMKDEWNVLLLESWSIALLRRRDKYRVHVSYSGRPGHGLGKIDMEREPPFLEILGVA